METVKWISLSGCDCQIRKTAGRHQHECFGKCYEVDPCLWHRMMALEARSFSPGKTFANVVDRKARLEH